jgi:hypothetical protein
MVPLLDFFKKVLPIKEVEDLAQHRFTAFPSRASPLLAGSCCLASSFCPTWPPNFAKLLAWVNERLLQKKWARGCLCHFTLFLVLF